MREAVRSGRRANFYITENGFIDHYAREVGPVGIAVYHVLERHTNCETRSTWIGTAKMAALLSLSQRTIQRTLKTLEDLKLIRILRTENMTTYVIVPVPPRAKTSNVIPLFDQISVDQMAGDEFTGNMNQPEQTSHVSSNATETSQFATTMSHATTSASHNATSRSLTGDTRDAAYKDEQDLLDKSSDQDSPTLQKLAHQIIVILGLPATDSNRRMVEAAIYAETTYTGQSLQEATEVIAKAAIRDRSSGIAINKFYFEDAKWRLTRGQNVRPSRAEQRKLDNLEVNARVKRRFRDLLGAS